LQNISGSKTIYGSRNYSLHNLTITIADASRNQIRIELNDIKNKVKKTLKFHSVAQN